MSLTREQQAIVQRVRRAMADAKKAGLVTFCDVESWGIRFVPAADLAANEDAREQGDFARCSDMNPSVAARAQEGETVHCASQCGTPEGANL